MNKSWTKWLIFVSVVHLIYGLDKLNSTKLIKDKEVEFTKEVPPSTGAQAILTNFGALKKPTLAAPTRRKSELSCDQYIKFKTLLESRRKRASFVAGGRPSKPGEFPYVGAVGWRAIKGTWIFLCASSLIRTKHMLTAAHCSKVSKRYPNVANTTPEIVRLGQENIDDLNSNGQTPYDVQIQKIIKHPQYVSPKKYFDIAIIELQDYVDFDKKILPACLWTNHDTSSLGNEATIAGWGVINTTTFETSKELQVADVDLLSSDVCNDLLKSMCYHLWCGMSESQLCAGKLSGGVDTCQGDSGGPLQVLKHSSSNNEASIHYLIGITSFGFGCARENTPAVYTRISSFIDWIENIVWGSAT